MTQQPTRQAVPALVGWQDAVEYLCAFEQDTAFGQRFYQHDFIILADDLQFTAIAGLPVVVEIDDHGDDAVAAIGELIQMALVERAGWVVGQVKLKTTQAKKTVAVEKVYGFCQLLPIRR